MNVLLTPPQRVMVPLVRFLVCAFAVALGSSALALQRDSARVTRVIKDVTLLPHQAASRPATVSDNVTGGTAVRTGTESRAELTFKDETITRLGANTIFSFNEGSREVDLSGGAILMQVPRDGGESKIVTMSITASITGGTALLESNKNWPIKFLVLEGVGRFYRNGHADGAVVLHGGEMIMMTVDGRISRPAHFNERRVFKTSKLITQFGPLANADLIMAVIKKQEAGHMTTTDSESDILAAVDQKTNSSRDSVRPQGNPNPRR